VRTLRLLKRSPNIKSIRRLVTAAEGTSVEDVDVEMRVEEEADMNETLPIVTSAVDIMSPTTVFRIINSVIHEGKLNISEDQHCAIATNRVNRSREGKQLPRQL